jgi:N-acyl-D-amino-acid deacylase
MGLQPSPLAGGQLARIRSRRWLGAGLGSFLVWLAVLSGTPWSGGPAEADATDARSADSGSLVIRDALIVDGTGAPAFPGSVRIRDGRIAEVGVAAPRAGEQVVNARGLVLAPGFIDTHSHHDGGLFEEPGALGAVSQGITTIVVGQDGGSNLPLARFFGRLEAEPAAVNVASFVGHNTLRGQVMGDDARRPATPSEVQAMADLLREELGAGALGLSSGLEYDSGIYSETEEVVALARVAGAAGGLYISHVRSEDRALLEALDEAIRIGREADVPVQVSHMKLAMRSLWGQADQVLARLDGARARGVRVRADVYPYTAWQSTMTVLFPDRDFTDLEAARFAVDEAAPPDRFLISRFQPDPSLEGRTLSEISEARGTEPARTLLDLIEESRAAREAGRPGGESVIAESMADEDVARLLQWPHTVVSSDGGLRGGHPRGFGAFPRVLGRYVRDEGVLTLEEAVRKMTSLPAEHMGIRERGVIRAGAQADLVLFDPERVRDRATFQEPRLTAVGIETVWVNGVEVFRDGEVTGARPGVVIRRGDLSSLRLDPFRVARIDSVFVDFDDPRSPGCALGIVEEGRPIHARGYGMANLEHGIPLGPSSIFRIASVSKQFSAAVMVLLEEDGLISLDDEVRRHIPDLPAYERPLTLRHLIHHTSGLRDYLSLMALAGVGDDDIYGEEDVVAALIRQEGLNFPPGDRHLYSNSGYFLMSQIVRRTTGKTLREYAEERIFGPLGMNRTHFHDDHTEIVPERATGYAPRDGGFRVSTTRLDLVGDGGVFTSVDEMARWEALFQGALGDDHPLAFLPGRMLEAGVLSNGEAIHYAFGLGHGELRGLPTVSHGGSFVGYRAYLLRFPEQAVGITILCNRADAVPGRLASRVGAVLLEDEMEPEEETSPAAPPGAEAEEAYRPAPGEISVFMGDYWSDELAVGWTLALDDGELVIEAPAGLAGALTPVGADRFRRGGITLDFERDGEGRVVELRVGTGRAWGIRFVPRTGR